MILTSDQTILSMTFGRSFGANIRYFQKIFGSETPGRVIYAGDTEFSSDHYQVLHFANAFGGVTE